MLPRWLQHAAIGEAAAFVGRGPTFEIWQPGGARRPTRPGADAVRWRRAALCPEWRRQMSPLHKPVLLEEVIEALLPVRRIEGAAVMTAPSSSTAPLRRRRLVPARCSMPQNCTVFGHRPRILSAIKGAASLMERHPAVAARDPGRSATLLRLLAERGVAAGRTASPRLRRLPRRSSMRGGGFSFRFSGPLDMRMESEAGSRVLADLRERHAPSGRPRRSHLHLRRGAARRRIARCHRRPLTICSRSETVDRAGRDRARAPSAATRAHPNQIARRPAPSRHSASR